MLKGILARLIHKLTQKWQIYQFRRACRQLFDRQPLEAIQRSAIGIDTNLKLLAILCRDKAAQSQLSLNACYQLAIVAERFKLLNIQILAPGYPLQKYPVKLAIRAMKIDLQWALYREHKKKN